MPRNSSGVYVLPEAAFIAGTTILSAPVNNDLSDIASALTGSIAVNGSTSMTGPFKAATGSVTAPSYTYASATGTGFYLSGTNEFSWTAAGILQGTFASTGTVTWVGAQVLQSTLAVTGGSTFTGTITANGAVNINNVATITNSGASPLVIVRSENAATETVAVRYSRGSGAGNVGERKVTSTGANDVSAITDYVGGVALLSQSATAVSPKKNLSIDAGIIVVATAGYCDLTEIAAPASPSADTARLYAVDEAGTTNLAWKDSAGVISGLRLATQTDMETATSVLRNVTPGRQHFHPGHPKAGGNFDGSGTPAFRTGDYGMGAITDNGTGNYTLALDTAFNDTNYWINGYARKSGGGGADILSGIAGDIKTASSFQVKTVSDGGGADDSTEVGITFWGDYA